MTTTPDPIEPAATLAMREGYIKLQRMVLGNEAPNDFDRVIADYSEACARAALSAIPKGVLESRVRELERDAARWKWLNGPDTEWEPLDSAWLSKHDLYGQGPEDLNEFVDAAIDSARGEVVGGEK